MTSFVTHSARYVSAACWEARGGKEILVHNINQFKTRK
jgi:hypothetical protein